MLISGEEACSTFDFLDSDEKRSWAYARTVADTN
jgi:hypothetical protein